MRQPKGAAARITCGQRRELDDVIDHLMAARAGLVALIEQEPEGTRDLLTIRLHVDACTVAIMDRYADPVPPAPASTAPATASGGATDGQAA